MTIKASVAKLNATVEKLEMGAREMVRAHRAEVLSLTEERDTERVRANRNAVEAANLQDDLNALRPRLELAEQRLTSLLHTSGLNAALAVRAAGLDADAGRPVVNGRGEVVGRTVTK